MIRLKSQEDIAKLRESGRILAEARKAVLDTIDPGMTTLEIDERAGKEIQKRGGKSWFKGYRPSGAPSAYPAYTCISINEEIVHGFPSKDRVLKQGDIVSLDMGVAFEGLLTDSAVTVGIGPIDKESQNIINTTREALYIGIEAAQIGNTTGDIGAAIESFVRPYGYGIFRELVGHGVGYEPHEEPFVPNFGKQGKGIVLEEGLVSASEPMLSLGRRHIKSAPNGHTYVTEDGSRSTHFEHTVALTKDGPLILTEI